MAMLGQVALFLSIFAPFRRRANFGRQRPDFGPTRTSLGQRRRGFDIIWRCFDLVRESIAVRLDVGTYSSRLRHCFVDANHRRLRLGAQSLRFLENSKHNADIALCSLAWSHAGTALAPDRPTETSPSSALGAADVRPRPREGRFSRSFAVPPTGAQSSAFFWRVVAAPPSIGIGAVSSPCIWVAVARIPSVVYAIEDFRTARIWPWAVRRPDRVAGRSGTSVGQRRFFGDLA